LTLRKISFDIGCNTGTLSKWFKDIPKNKNKCGHPKGNKPWNKNVKFIAMIGNQYASLGEKAKPDAGRKRAQRMFPQLKDCELCGAKDKIIRHHKNENTLDNRKSNIQFLCRKCHINLHRGNPNSIWKKHVCKKLKKK
jgi:hypothetical protein